MHERITPEPLNRERVTQALERVRQAAKKNKKEKFTALLHHINADTLKLAFFALKRDAAAGVDGTTWEKKLQRLEGSISFQEAGSTWSN